MSSQLVPVKSGQITKQKNPRDLSPATIFSQRLPAYRIQDLGPLTIYEFWKIGCKSSVGFTSAMRDKEIRKQIALITIFRDRSSEFQLSYYPAEGEAQIVKNLPISQLSVAVDDLIAAGFGPNQSSLVVAEKKMQETPKLPPPKAS